MNTWINEWANANEAKKDLSPTIEKGREYIDTKIFYSL